MTKHYKTYDEIRSSRIAERRAQALAALDDAQEIASAAGCRLIVFGSLVEGGFHEDSDIDAALFGEPAASAIHEQILGCALSLGRGHGWKRFHRTGPHNGRRHMIVYAVPRGAFAACGVLSLAK
jgi:predicted nucleotidyltransferase